MASAQLHRIQAWLQDAILDPAAADRAPEFLTASAALTARQRLAIYQQGYRARLVGCLRGQFPVLCKLLGEEAFDRFALQYLRAQPSRSYTLEALGAGFAGYLGWSRPDTGHREAWIDLVIDVARYERAAAEAFAAADPDTTSSTAALPPAGSKQWRHIVVALSPALRTLVTTIPVHEIVAIARDNGAVAELPRPRATYLAVFRDGYAVTATELDAETHRLLVLLGEGHSLAAAHHRTQLSIVDIDRCVRSWITRRIVTYRPAAVAASGINPPPMDEESVS